MIIVCLQSTMLCKIIQFIRNDWVSNNWADRINNSFRALCNIHLALVVLFLYYEGSLRIADDSFEKLVFNVTITLSIIISILAIPVTIHFVYIIFIQYIIGGVFIRYPNYLLDLRKEEEEEAERNREQDGVEETYIDPDDKETGVVINYDNLYIDETTD